MNIEVWALIGTAFATFLAALFAAASAKATRDAARGPLVLQLLEQYWKMEFSDDIRRIREWFCENGKHAPGLFSELRSRTLNEEDTKRFESIDKSRRAVKSYFRKVHQLHVGGYLTYSDVVNLLAPEHRAKTLVKIEGLEPSWRESYETEMYEFYSNIHRYTRTYAQQGNVADSQARR